MMQTKVDLDLEELGKNINRYQLAELFARFVIGHDNSKSDQGYYFSEVLEETKKLVRTLPITDLFPCNKVGTPLTVDTLIDLVKDDITVKIKYTNIKYYTVPVLIDLGFIEVVSKEDEDSMNYWQYVVKATDKLKEFIESYKDENDCYPYGEINDKLIELTLERKEEEDEYSK